VIKSTKSVCFTISGEFVTNLSREWLYLEKRPYKKVIDFLLACMCGTELKEKTLKKYANDVLLGKRKFIGNTANDTFCMVNDDVNIIDLFPLYFENKIKKQIRIIKDKPQKLKIDNNRLFPERVVVSDKHYGWLNPQGVYYEVSWGKHEAWAMEYIKLHYPAEYEKTCYYGDFLKSKKWILLHNPCGGAAEYPAGCIGYATNKQKDFLYDYFLNAGRAIDAKNIIKEEDGYL